MEPSVTVLITAYNAGRYLSAALDSLLLQSYPYWRAVVIDDASTDDSLASADKYFQDRRFTLLRNYKNMGQSISLNRGLALSCTRYTVQLDSDDWFASEALALLVKTADSLPEKVALVSGNLMMVVENTAGRVVREQLFKNSSFSDKYEFLQADCSQWPRFYRTAALKRIGGWPTDDPYGGRYMEDKRILLRLIEEYHFHWIDELLYYHRRHSGNQTNLTAVYNEMTEWVVCDALRRWGNHYEPVFKKDNFERLRLLKLQKKSG